VNWNDIFLTFVATLGGGGAMLMAAAWLTKTVINSQLERKAEVFRTNLQADANVAIERLKNTLQMSAEEHRVRYSNLQERRARRIAELYERIVAFSIECNQYVVQHGWEEENRSEAFNELDKQFVSLSVFVETSKIYLPSPLCDLLDNVLRQLRKTGIDIFVYAREHRTKGDNDRILAAFSAFEAEIPKARAALVVEFRRLLGVE
jgi:hypothetical protein